MSEEKKNKQERRAYAKRGACTSKMMSFRCDGDNVTCLQRVMNKGKLINDLLRDYFCGLPQEPEDYDPDENNIDYNMP